MTIFPMNKIKFLNLILIILILFTVILLSRDIIKLTVLKSPEGLTKKNEVAISFKKRKDIMEYSPILEKNPFGRPLKLIPLLKTVNKESPTSLSDILLVGTVVGPESYTYAIFENPSNQGPFEQEIYALGSSVYDIGKLTRVEKNWVEITNGMEKFKIYIIEPSENGKRKNRPNQRTSFVKKLSDKQYILDRKRVEDALNNPEQILTDARLLPNIRNGKQEGFRIFEVRKGGLYESLGLKNGDILLRINDLEISNPEVAIQAMTAIKGMDTINLDIIRNNSKMTIKYQIR
jgi:general secretion pathway protein C